MRSSSLALLVLLSFAPAKSTTEHERLGSTSAKVPAELSSIASSMRAHHKRMTARDNQDPGHLETLFIPEDPNQYEQILTYVRKVFERVQESSNHYDQGMLTNPGANERNRTPVTMYEDERIVASKEELNTETWSKDSEKEILKSGTLWEKELAETFARTTSQQTDEDEITLLKRNKDKEAGPDEEDFLEAATFGLEAMKELYAIKEPMLYMKGVYLGSDDPAKRVAIFNDQTEEARALAKYGFAVLQGTTRFKRKFPNSSTESLLSRRSQNNLLRLRCPNRGVPVCPAASLRYRTSDGSCNNLQHLWWGSAMSTMHRFLPPVYADGIQSIRKSVTGQRLPSAREVTTVIHEDRDVPLASVTHMLMQWGQFVDHDLTATGQSRGFNGTVPQCCLKFGSGFQPPEFQHPECMPIHVSPRDSFFGPLGVKCLEFVRSGPAPKEDCEFGPREQLTQVTSYLDASTVYSSNAFQTDTLRLFRNGLLQYGKLQSQRPLLPKLDSDLCKRGSLSTNCFRAGDGRLGEQPALTSLHVAFLRLHNRIATKLAALNPHWSDEKLFQESRRIVGAVVQHITYREFLPIVLGQDVMKIFDLQLLKKGYYDGYDPKVNPTVANEFSTAAYRFGHSLVQHSFVRFDRHHQPIFNNVSIHSEFTNPANLETAGSVDRLLLGLINQPSQRRDEHISEELTNHLFQTPSFPFGMDLASINIQRGRDHGIPPYVQWREPCGLSPIRSFDDLERAMPPSTVNKFRLVYSSVDDIDLFSGGLAEKSVQGGLVGPTFACIIGQQFSNLRRGDRFWYENPDQAGSFTPGQLQQLRRVSLAQVLCATMDDIETVQPFVLLIADTLKNQRLSCNDPIIGQLNLEFWAERPTQSTGRAGFLEKFRKTTTQSSVTTARYSGTTKKDSSTKTLEQEEKTFPQIVKPPKASVHQQNRVVVKRPLGPPDNVTIVVQNNAINSPVFVNDAIYGSSIKVNPSLHQQTQQSHSPNPSNEFTDRRPVHLDPLQFVQVFSPPSRPIPTAPPSLTNQHYSSSYVPYAFQDPNNPNPLSQGFHSSYLTNDVVFESFPGSTPRPTLYTYYTNFHKPTTPRPGQDVDEYLVGYVPQDQTVKPTQRPYPQASRPAYGSVGNQQSQNDHGYETATWQKFPYQQSLLNRPSNAGQTNSPVYVDRPNSESKDSDHKYGSLTRPIDQIEYSTWSSVSSNNAQPTDNTNDRYHHPDRPVYQSQSTTHPNQFTPNGYQQASGRPDISQAYQNQLLDRPSVGTNELSNTDNPNAAYLTNPSVRPTSNDRFEVRPSVQNDPAFYSTQSNYQSNEPYKTTSKPHYGQSDNAIGAAYLELTTRPKPPKIHSVTILGTVPTSQGGHEIDRIENRVTSEVPRPLASWASNHNDRPVIRKPGQYYYEKNVLHRYPDKIEEPVYSKADQPEERHKTVANDASIDQFATDATVRNHSSIDANRNDTIVDEKIASQTRDKTNHSTINDEVEHKASSQEIERVASLDRDGHWMNPQEDSSLPSALEVPEISSDNATVAKELPRPIKFRSYAT